MPKGRLPLGVRPKKSSFLVSRPKRGSLDSEPEMWDLDSCWEKMSRGWLGSGLEMLDIFRKAWPWPGEIIGSVIFGDWRASVITMFEGLNRARLDAGGRREVEWGWSSSVARKLGRRVLTVWELVRFGFRSVARVSRFVGLFPIVIRGLSPKIDVFFILRELLSGLSITESIFKDPSLGMLFKAPPKNPVSILIVLDLPGNLKGTT